MVVAPWTWRSRAYDYTDAAALLAAFWKEVESVMQEKESGHEDT
jgi:hypothetical protein